MVRYFTTKQLRVKLHEDLHPHQHEMWVDVQTADGEHLVNVQVHARLSDEWSVGVVLWCDVLCVWRLTCVRGWCACVWRTYREVHNDASCRLLLNKFNIAMGYPAWRPFEIISSDDRIVTGRHRVWTAMGFARRVRARIA